MNAVAKRLDDGRVVDANGEIWEQPVKHPLTLDRLEVCEKCGHDVMVARTVLGGRMRLDSDGGEHLCRGGVRAWPRRGR